MKKKTLTVFTPAYNRAHTIGRTYESLCRQTCNDFEWLIIDDGSMDGTQELIEGWIKENKIPIRYIYQENQGMHGAHNTAYRNIHTELNICIDSDDYMPDDAVELIVSLWKEKGTEEFAGIIGLDIDQKGNILGTKYPDDLCEIPIGGYKRKGKKADTKQIYRTDIINQYSEYPIFEGEKYVGLGYKYIYIENNYKMLVLNQPLVVVEYQQDGSSVNMYRQYWKNPKGFAFTRKIDMMYPLSLKRKLITCIHYVSSSIRSKNMKFIQESPLPIMTICAILPGLLLFILTWWKVITDSKMRM